MTTADLLATNGALVAGFMVTLWLLSLAKRDASIVDIFWGPGFALVGASSAILGTGYGPRRWLIATLVGLWGLRLGAYIGWRNRGKEEDYRYQQMRENQGRWFPLISLLTVFGLQGALMWVISLPIQIAACRAEPARLGAWAFVGGLVWAVGLFFEAAGDAQLARFKAEPSNRGEVMDRGLWRYTRHPNYFGDACLWWGLYLVAAGAEGTWWTIFSPVVMTFLLLKVSGVAMLESTITERRPAYRDYIERTSAFIPWPPKKRDASEG